MTRLPEHIDRHIHTIAEQEKEFHANQTALERMSHRIGGFVGSLSFIVLHLVWFTLWIGFNLLPRDWVHHFDPFPFALLAIAIEIEGIFLLSFILMRQNRMSRRSDEREHLTLQVLLLAEQEITTLIDIERRKSVLAGHSDIATDREIETLSQPTQVADLTRELQDKLL